ncbi:unnamed protein product [Oppiella nova]|uniref:Uncharacterized protein n=1 Tax=Oppiella nova TaxID=334625 RepID=A0A7R9MRZ4_9ACAR|nr:unnamed protein product [Oppiella nova]CAG2182208.1 unnamed protein product [Oppiella nova]
MIRDENKEVEEYQKLISKVLPQKPELKPKPKQTVGAGSEGQEARQTVSKKALKEEIKLKEKLRLKDIKERKRLKKLEKQIQQKADKTDGKCGDGLDEKVDKQSKHLSLKSTLKPLKKLGLKSLSTDKSDKKSDKVVKTSSNPSPPTPTPPPNASDSVATGQTLAEDPVLANGANK